MIILFALVVLFATIVGSISGIGGGVVIKPVMDAVFNLTSTQISFLSGTTVLTMTIVSLIKARDQFKLNTRVLMLAIGGAVGGILGKQLFDLIKVAAGNEAFVGLVQNIIMVLLTGAVFLYTLKKESIVKKDYQSAVLSFLIGLFLGLVSAFLGIGGGPINIMILSYLFSFNTKESALVSLFIIFFSQVFSLVTSLITISIPDFDPYLLIMMMICAVIGSMMGRKFSKKMDNKAVDKLFMTLMLIIIMLSVFNCFKFSALL